MTKLNEPLLLEKVEKIVNVNVTPDFYFSFDIMKEGVTQHIDRKYTYDVIPPELLDGILFQGIHRPPKGTLVELEILTPAKVYFFFHHTVDGGYSEIFKRLKNWKKCKLAPQYDVHNGDHGLKMVMYSLEAPTGTYSIPATTEDRACFSMIFKPLN